VDWRVSELCAGYQGEHNWRALRLSAPENMDGAARYVVAFALPYGEVVLSQTFDALPIVLPLWSQLTQWRSVFLTLRALDATGTQLLGESPRVKLKFLPAVGGDAIDRDDSLAQSEEREILAALDDVQTLAHTHPNKPLLDTVALASNLDIDALI
jgi:hypothetical protein